MRIRKAGILAFRSILLLVAVSLIGYLLLAAVYCLPTDRMKRRFENESLETVMDEGGYPILLEGYKCTALDNYTDSMMLSTALYDGPESTLEKAAGGYRWLDNSKDGVEKTLGYFAAENESVVRKEYARYWHGYLLLLKPVLLFLSVSQIRLINMFCQLLLFVAIVLAMNSAGLKRYILPFSLAFLLLTPHAISNCLHFSTAFYTMMIAMLVLLRYHQTLERRQWVLPFFMLTGALTSYVDLSTYPLITLGMPLVLYAVLYGSKKGEFRKLYPRLVGCAAFWAIGYVGMWAMKWLIASIVLHENMFANALQAVFYRTSNAYYQDGTDPFTLKEAISFNIGVYRNRAHTLLLLCPTLYYLWRVIRVRSFGEAPLLIAILLIGCLPFAWYIVASNHSYVHFFFTHRVLVITAFAWFVFLARLATPVGERELVTVRS